jgi:putative transposase
MDPVQIVIKKSKMPGKTPEMKPLPSRFFALGWPKWYRREMPRKPRECPGGLIYHVLNRSVAGIKIFSRDKDYLAFERVLVQAQAKFPVALLAYSIMPNHWHLVLRPEGDGDLSKFMHWLSMTHVQRWRTSHQNVGYGPLYQGRFKSFAIEADEHLITVLRYVERNALRANLVETAEKWRWCSLYRLVPPHADAPPRPSLSR